MWPINFFFPIQVAENLAQLMYSVMMTGYMFKNAQYRLELQQCLEQVALPDVQDTKVLVFHLFDGCMISVETWHFEFYSNEIPLNFD